MPFIVPAVVYMDNLKVYGSSFSASAFRHSPPPQEPGGSNSLEVTSIRCLPIFCLMIEE